MESTEALDIYCRAWIRAVLHHPDAAAALLASPEKLNHPRQVSATKRRARSILTTAQATPTPLTTAQFIRANQDRSPRQIVRLAKLDGRTITIDQVERVLNAGRKAAETRRMRALLGR